jgi:hypothetical protein
VIPNIDIQYPNNNFNFIGSLRENQIAVEQESWDQLEKYGTSTLGLYPGFGKTILGAKLASRAKLLTVVLVHREILTIQWKKTFNDFTDAVVWIVGEKIIPSSYNVIICMDTRWHLIPKHIRDNVGFIIIDEAHAFCTRTHVGCLLAFHPKYILAESATLERDDKMETMIYAICGNHGVYREINKPFTVIKVITNTKPIRKKNRIGGVDWSSLVKNTLFDDRRNQIILNMVSTTYSQDTILILTSLVDHVRLLHQNLMKIGVSCDYMCGDKKIYSDCRVLIGTTSKVGTGFDQATSCPNYSGKRFNVVIIVCSMKKYSMLVQNVGRGFRADYPTIVYLVDNDEIYKSHWYKCRKWFLTRGGIIKEQIIPNAEFPSSHPPEIIQQSWIRNKVNKLNNINPIESPSEFKLNIQSFNSHDPSKISNDLSSSVNPIYSNGIKSKTDSYSISKISSLHHELLSKNQTISINPTKREQPSHNQITQIISIKQNSSVKNSIIPILPIKTDSSIPRMLIQPETISKNPITSPMSNKTETISKIPITPTMSTKTESSQKIQITPTMSIKTETISKIPIIPTMSIKTETISKIPIIPTMSIKTESSTKIEIKPTMSIKTEPLPKIRILPTMSTKTELLQKMEIKPTMSIKTEPLPKIQITPTMSTKMELFKKIEITPTISAKTESSDKNEIKPTISI